MISILAPILDVNSETGIIVSWHKQNRDEVKRGDAIVEIETSKSIIVVDAQDEGFLLQAAPENAEVSLKVLLTMISQTRHFSCLPDLLAIVTKYWTASPALFFPQAKTVRIVSAVYLKIRILVSREFQISFIWYSEALEACLPWTTPLKVRV